MGGEIATFEDDDDGYRAWLRGPDQYVLTARRPHPGAPWSYKLHQKDCRALPNPLGGRKLTSNPKRCGSREALTAWAQEAAGESPDSCSVCM
jgi:hypothetical protein